MKAAVLYKANMGLEVVDVEQQGPKPGEVRVKVKAAGICHSDWHIMNGDWPLPLPMVLGHEAAGIVDEITPGVTNVKPGDHVIFSFRPHCGRCLYCSIGRSILCDGHNDTPRWVMFDGTHRLKRNGDEIKQMARIGTFAEQVVCPAEHLVPIKNEMPWAQAALVGCCVPTGVGAVTRCAEVEPGASVMIVGCGGVGLNVVQGARLAGAAVIVGMAAMNVRAPITPYMMALQEKCIKGTMYGSVRPNLDFPWLVDQYLAGHLKVDELVSRTYRLEEINEGFAALRGGQVARGVVVL